MDLTGNVNFIRAIMKANTVISVSVRFIHVVILQPEENGLKAKTFGTARNAYGYIQKMQSNV